MGAPNVLKAATKAATWPLAPSNVLKCAPGGGDSQKGLHFTKRSSLHGRTRLIKWGLPGGGVKSAKVAADPSL